LIRSKKSFRLTARIKIFARLIFGLVPLLFGEASSDLLATRGAEIKQSKDLVTRQAAPARYARFIAEQGVEHLTLLI
jgi:hypothetical protein